VYVYVYVYVYEYEYVYGNCEAGLDRATANPVSGCLHARRYR
jgi:hypothetical protein